VSVLGIGFVSQFRFAQKEQALRRALVHAVQAGIIAEDEADGLLIIEDEASGERAVAHVVLSGTLLALGRNGAAGTGATGARGFRSDDIVLNSRIERGYARAMVKYFVLIVKLSESACERGIPMFDGMHIGGISGGRGWGG
jgi:hypothetical protein